MQHDYNGFPNQDKAFEINGEFPAVSDVLVHNDLQLLVPMFPIEGALSLQPGEARVLVDANELVIADMNTPWDIDKHAVARKPISLGCG